ncbi:hypothetical protein CCACVL1_01677 [Corchorus capsularis]|uniref:Uncharacterized protein n=1 Tax=Corchorus capsularis TaxID=210143 RepID=A0A1R3KGQ5_COCAP|nr:hypothetical protein CCACVL1_01677 [Corchorus capsularis]
MAISSRQVVSFHLIQQALIAPAHGGNGK